MNHARVRSTVADTLAVLARHVFAPGTKLTLIARVPDEPGAYVITGDDDLDALAAFITRVREVACDCGTAEAGEMHDCPAAASPDMAGEEMRDFPRPIRGGP